VKAAQYINKVPNCEASLVTTNSIAQGQQVDLIWPTIFSYGVEIGWAHTSFKWSNLATNKATVTVVIISLKAKGPSDKYLYSQETKKRCQHISPYLLDSNIISITPSRKPLFSKPQMKLGNMPYGKGLLMTQQEKDELLTKWPNSKVFIRRFAGGEEFLHSKARYCLWIDDEQLAEAKKVPFINERIEDVRAQRSKSSDAGGKKLAARPHQFRERNASKYHSIVLARTSSEERDFIPAGLADSNWIFSSETFVLYDAEIWNLAIIISRLHLVWIKTVCGQLETRIRYSNTLGWNNFPIPMLTEKNKKDLTKCAEDILLAREAHFPATIAELYDPERMPEDLRLAHSRNDEVLERIFIGRRFKNNTERLEKLFELYKNSLDQQ